MDDIILGTTICQRHRDRFGIRWRCNKKNRARPHEWASHMAVKGERGLTLAQSQKLDLRLTCCSSKVTTTYGRSCSTVAKFYRASSFSFRQDDCLGYCGFRVEKRIPLHSYSFFQISCVVTSQAFFRINSQILMFSDHVFLNLRHKPREDFRGWYAKMAGNLHATY